MGDGPGRVAALPGTNSAEDEVVDLHPEFVEDDTFIVDLHPPFPSILVTRASRYITPSSRVYPVPGEIHAEGQMVLEVALGVKLRWPRHKGSSGSFSVELKREGQKDLLVEKVVWLNKR